MSTEYCILESQQQRWRSYHVLWRIVVESTGETVSIGTSLTHTAYDLTDTHEYTEWIDRFSRIVLTNSESAIRCKGWAKRLIPQMKVQVVAISSLGERQR